MVIIWIIGVMNLLTKLLSPPDPPSMVQGSGLGKQDLGLGV